ncbi:MAG: hypothetical protein ACJAV7_001012 [Flavobacteriales bacterium]|jgi:hypothetical protein
MGSSWEKGKIVLNNSQTSMGSAIVEAMQVQFVEICTLLFKRT